MQTKQHARPQLPADLTAVSLDPSTIRARMGPRRDAAAIDAAGGVDAYLAAAAGGGKLAGSWVRFSLDEGMQLVREEGVGCRWEEARGGPGAVVEQVCRVGSVGVG